MTLEVRKGQNGAGQNGVAAIKTELATAVSPHNLQFEGCPHFALSNDPDTRILFPSPAGTCFHVQESAAVNLDHQQTYCLHDNHTACPIFQQAHPAVLPADIRLHAIPNTNAHLLKIILTIIVVLAIVGLGAYAFLGGFNGNNGTTTADNSGNSAVAAVALPDATETAEPTATPSPAPTNTPTATATPAPTETAEPTATQTPPPTATAEPTATATLQPTNTPAPTATAVPLPQAIINVSRLNIRSGPGTAYPIVALADSGAQFDITGQLTDGSWWQICCVNGDEIGWVFGESVIINDDTAAVPFVAPPPLPTATPSP